MTHAPLLWPFAVLTAVACSSAGGGSRSAGDDLATGGTDGSGFQSEDTAAPAQDGAVSGADTASEDAAPGPCTEGEARCASETTRETCDKSGAWTASACGDGTACFLGICAPKTCEPGAAVGQCVSASARVVCNSVGTGPTSEECPSGQTCYLGNCGNYVCEPGSRACLGFGAVQECKADGSGFVQLEKCEKGGSCTNGKCVSACDVDIKSATYRGCSYYAVDLDNIEGGEFVPVAVVVSVPAEVEDAVVSIRDVANDLELGPTQLDVSDMTVAAGTLKIFTLPLGYDIDGSGKTKRSFRVKTSAPATVHQFNPLNGDDVYTNDASLLLPTASGGTEYYAMSWALRENGATPLRGFMTIIATQPGETLVTVNTTAAVAAGPEGSGVAAIAPGQQVSFVLSEGEVLNLEADGPEGSDLSGSRIVADKQINVFGGHECANVPLGVGACDHLEQQLIPVATWGKKVVVDTFAARSPSQFDVVRVMGGGNDVTVETKPPVPGYEKFMLQRGTYVTFTTKDSVEVAADGPIQVGHYMIGSNFPGFSKVCPTSGIGDPSLTLVVPTQQYLDTYTVLTPPGYTENYLNVVAPAGASITVDGVAIDGMLAPVTGTDWVLARVPVNAGVHTVTGKKKFGLTAYGYDCDVSYAYPGGLQLQILTGGGP